MIYGLYLSAEGARAQSLRLDVVANNLANASTTAFKRDLAVFQAHRPERVPAGEELPGGLERSTGGVSLAGVATDFREGPLVPTGGPLDLALRGPGFFRVSDGTQEFLTRNGQLTRDVSGRLVTQDGGLAILNTSGSPILVPEDTERIEIGPDGTVVGVGPGSARTELGRIDVVQPESLSQLQKVGNSLYRALGPVSPVTSGVQIRQGFLEASSVEPVREMMELIEASRAFEANVNLIRAQDDTLAQLLQVAQRP